MHPLHRPIQKYFSDKEEQHKQQEEEELLERIKEKNLEESKIGELKKIRELIKAEKSKMKFCLVCKRKFANATHLRMHEEKSALHKQNLQAK